MRTVPGADREGAPVPGAASQHEAVERTQPERTDGVEVHGIGELDAGGRDRDHGVDVEWHQRLCVAGVAVHARAPRPVVGVLDLVVGMADVVDVGVAPGELDVHRIGGFGVVDGQRAERRPSGGGERFGADGDEAGLSHVAHP